MNFKFLRKMKNITLLLFLFAMLMASCKEDNNFMCTDIYCTISIKITYPDEIPYVLDSFKVNIVSTGKDVTINPELINYDIINKYGLYPVIDDSYVNNDNFFNKKTEVQFTGYVADIPVIKQNLTVGADRCHVKNYSGDQNIILKQLDYALFKKYLIEKNIGELNTVINSYFSILDEEHFNLFIAEIMKCSDIKIVYSCYECIKTLPVMSEVSMIITTDSGEVERTIDLSTNPDDGSLYVGLHDSEN